MAENSKKVFWVLDKESSTFSVDMKNSVKAELESRFQFKLVIYKDAQTHIESMKITNFKDGNENGSIITSIVDLGRDMKDFKKFGVVMGDTYFRDLAREIEKEYANIEVGEVIFSKDDTRYSNLITEVKEFFAEGTEYISEEFCYIPVNMFNELSHDCGYGDYELKNLRKQLDQDEYIRVVSGRYAILKRFETKPERVIAFHRQKLDITIPEKQEKRKKGMLFRLLHTMKVTNSSSMMVRPCRVSVVSGR